MKFPKYPVITSPDHHMYLFFSEGPKGKIPKGVIYSQIEGSLYNLSFGDWDLKLRQLDDYSRSNNGDRDKILATVAYTTLDFTDKFPDIDIFVEGSTTARTRLYQMGITNNLLEINNYFRVEGYRYKKWECFQPGRNYEAFLIERK
jgi:hypothetical protein